MTRNEKDRAKRQAQRIDQFKLLVTQVVFAIEENPEMPMNDKIAHIAETLEAEYRLKKKV